MQNQRSEEHTSELQSRSDLVCRLLLEKKNTSELQSRSDLVCRLLLEKKKKNATRVRSITSYHTAIPIRTKNAQTAKHQRRVCSTYITRSFDTIRSVHAIVCILSV